MRKGVKDIVLTGLALAVCAAVAQAADLKMVGIAVNNLGDPFYVSLSNGAEDAIKKVAPKAQVSTLSSDYDIVKQSNQIDSFISAGANLIIVTASDPKAIAPAIARAKAQGIAVVGADAVSNGLDAGVATDNLAAGHVACAELAKRLNGKGNIVIIPGPPIPPVLDRVKGCSEEMKGFPDIKILSSDQNAGGTRDGGLKIMQNLLTRFDKVDGAFVIAEEMAIGARIASVQAGRTNIVVTTVDGSPAIQKEMTGSDNQIVATAAQNPKEIGKEAAEIGIDLLAGKKVADPYRKLPPLLVTKEKISEYGGW
jgi:ribose transport system substrate-binding protein